MNNTLWWPQQDIFWWGTAVSPPEMWYLVSADDGFFVCHVNASFLQTCAESDMSGTGIIYIYMIYYIYICICIYISHVFKYIDVILLNVPNLSNTTRNQKLLGYRSMLAKSAPQFNRWIRASNVVDYKIFSGKHRKSYWKWLEIVDLPMKMVIFHMLVNPNKFLKSNMIPPPPSE